MTSLPPAQKNVRLIVEAVVDVVAISGLVTLAALKVVDAAAVVPVIVLIAGARVGAKLKGGAGGPGSSASVLFLAGELLVHAFLKRHHGGA